MVDSKFRVLELFSGIGGMHLALERLGLDYKVVAAVEINDMSNRIYRHNFPGINLLQKNIEGLTVKQILKLNPNMILMSPPCQPFTRSGLKKDLGDNRCTPLLHLLEILPELLCINYILLENVVGFESSQARNQVVEVLRGVGFSIQEYHLCPSQLNIPNKRPRYYLLAKREPLQFKYQVTPALQKELPVSLSNLDNNPAFDKRLAAVQDLVFQKTDDGKKCFKIGEILDDSSEDNFLKEKDVRFFNEFDLVGVQSRLSACFTKSYKRYFLGTGSVFIENYEELDRLDASQPNHTTRVLEVLRPRFFSTREILRLMCFPERFTFPSDVSKKQAAAVLGNSINVHVVSLLIGILTAE